MLRACPLSRFIFHSFHLIFPPPQPLPVRQRNRVAQNMGSEVDIDLPVVEVQSSSSATNSTENKRKASATPICNALKSKLFYILIVVICVLITVICFCLTLIYEKESNVTHSVNAWREELSLEKSVWFDAGLDELKAALNVKLNTRRAKNVVLFVGDGMGINTMTASRIYKHGEQGRLTWETFPHMGLLKVSRCQ